MVREPRSDTICMETQSLKEGALHSKEKVIDIHKGKQNKMGSLLLIQTKKKSILR